MIPLYARKMCSELYPNLYRDEVACRLVNEIDYDFLALAKSPAVSCSGLAFWRQPCGSMIWPMRWGTT